MIVTKTTHLIIDAGNSRIKWAIADLSEPALTLKNIDSAPTISDSANVKFSRLTAIAQGHEKLIIVASNVAGANAAAKLTEALKPHTIDFITSQVSAAGLINSYTDPASLGSDRFAALIATKQMQLADEVGSALVVMAGTALTMDALTADGVFLGGTIMPGLSLMRTMLNANTAKLPLVAAGDDATTSTADFARDTVGAIKIGTAQALTGAIFSNARRLQKIVGAPITIVLSGGDTAAILPRLNDIITDEIGQPYAIKVVDNIVLVGLAQYAKARLIAHITSPTQQLIYTLRQ
jgi:type III pantothenate kinase